MGGEEDWLYRVYSITRKDGRKVVTYIAKFNKFCPLKGQVLQKSEPDWPNPICPATAFYFGFL
ncbi:hypothetical protein THIOM_003394 [Candidatus Thiomargarita nelsonii]|uniref:Uncharacterized protein n=1 Tax=Candidatus Thiomargarita nelsonii TaxID=1003181 RepID=A0A0A6NY73_9GAMM|nr:hypothetical protein THIOM_003394 [Candidatus Thiomargarita nelsonii]